MFNDGLINNVWMHHLDHALYDVSVVDLHRDEGHHLHVWKCKGMDYRGKYGL
jgi:hypothetical protein